MALTYESIASTTLSVASATIDFNSISNTYTDLRLIILETGTTAGDCWFRFNNDSTSLYGQTFLESNGTTITTTRGSLVSQFRPDRIGSDTTIPGLRIIDIFNYSNTAVNKLVLTSASQDRNTLGYLTATVGLWAGTAAVGSINILRASGNYNIGTSATLYAIKAA